MEKELSNLKTDLRSLVISCKQEMNISRLRRDYREHCGSDIPCGKFNYRDINSFLRERLSDVFLFKGDYRNPILIPIVPDSVKHIDQMVGCQTSKIRGPKRASVYESPSNSGKENRNGWPSKQFTNSSPKVTPGNSIFGSYRNYPTENRYIPSIRESGPPNPVTTTQQPPKPVTSFKHDFNTRGPTHQPNHINTHPSPNVNKALPYVQPVQLETTKPMTNHQLAFADIPSLNWTPCGSSVSSSLCRESPSHTIELEETRVDSRQSFNLPSSSNSSGGKSPGRKSKRTILRDNFIKLAQLYPDGIWATEFDTKYKEVFGAVLNFNALGYQSITLMCSDFPDCWFQVRPTPRGDTLILPKGCETRTRDWTSPLVTTREPAMQLLKKIESKMCDMSLDALPGIEFDAYPPNALTLHDSIEQLDLPESHHVDSEFEIEVGEVCSPTNFWYLLYSPNHAVAMYSMMNDMNDFYDSPAGDEYKIRDQAAQPAMYCAARYHTDWQRAMILTNCVNKQLKVRHIDFGTIANLDISKVRFLKREWGDLPAQALRGRLAKIRPHSLGQEWPFKATRYFLRLIYEKRLIASTCSYDDEGKVLEMFLTDTSLAVDIHVTDELIRTGLAGICREQDADDHRERDSSLFEKYERYVVEHFHHLAQLEHYECPVTNDPLGYSIDYDEDDLVYLLANLAFSKHKHSMALLNDLFSAARKKSQEEIQMPDEMEEQQERDRDDVPLVGLTVPTEIPTWPRSNFPTPSRCPNPYLPHPDQPLQPVENPPQPVEYPHQPSRPVEYPHQPVLPVENLLHSVEYPHQPPRLVEYPDQPPQPIENRHQPMQPVEYPPQPLRPVERPHQPPQSGKNPHQPLRSFKYPLSQLQWPIDSNKYRQLGYPQYPPQAHPHGYGNPLMFSSPPFCMPPFHPIHQLQPYFPPTIPNFYTDSGRERPSQYNAAPQNTLPQSASPPKSQNVLSQNISRRKSVDATAIVHPERTVQPQPKAAKQTISTESQTVTTTKFKNNGFWDVNAMEFVPKNFVKSYTVPSVKQTATKTNSDESAQTSQSKETAPSCRNDKYIEHIGHRELYGKKVNIYKCNGKLWLSPYQMILSFWKDKNVSAPESLFQFKTILKEKLTEDIYSMHSITTDECGKAFLLEGFFEFSDEMLAICKDVLIPMKKALNFAIMFEHLLDMSDMFDLLTLVAHAVKKP